MIRLRVAGFVLPALISASPSLRAEPAPLRILRVASVQPMAYESPETGRITDIDADLADDVGRKLGRPVVRQDASDELAIAALVTGRVDLGFGLLDEPASRYRLDDVPSRRDGIQAYTLADNATAGEVVGTAGSR